MKTYGNQYFRSYINGILPIFDQFIHTYQGNVDNNFWIKVCDIRREVRSGVYSWDRKVITGWVLQLFGSKADVPHGLDTIPLPNIRVPVKLENCDTGKVTQCYIVGGFHGVYSAENRHKPVMSLSVISQNRDRYENPYRIHQ